MKKILSVLLGLVLACGLSVTAFAGEATISTTVPQRHTVTVEADGGKVIANNKVCGDTVLIERQKEQIYWIVPNEGKELDKLYYNGEDVTAQMAGSRFTAPALIGDAALRAVFRDAAATEGGYTVSGSVTDENGSPVPGATVDIGGYTGTTDENGSFAIPDVPPGTHPVVITDEKGNIIATGEITVSEPAGDQPAVGEDENGSPVITPGAGHTNIALTIVVNGDGSITLEKVDAYTRDAALDDPATAAAPAENGSAAVTLADGTQVTVTGITEDGLWLVVRPVADPQLVAWLETCVAPYGTQIYPMDIYFVDSRGVRTESTGVVTVTVETPKGYAEPIVCCVAPDGTVAVMSSSVNGNAITFRANRNNYYVLAEKIPGAVTAAGTQTGTANETDGQTSRPGTAGGAGGQAPQTGDAGRPWLWCAVMLLAGCGLIGCILIRRKKNRHKD